MLTRVATHAQNPRPLTAQKGQPVMKHATGTFEIKVQPAEVSEVGKAGGVGRMTIDKVFSGGIDGTSKGEMLTGVTQSTGSMAYVAIETVTAKVDGHSGTFVLSHNAAMMKSDPGAAVANIVVVPGSATGDLTGLSGTLIITNTGGSHSYDFAYTLPGH